MTPRKRQKTTMSTPASDSLQEKHETYTQWALAQGITIHGVAPSILPGRGVGLVADQPIKKDARLIFVPERAMIKPDVAQLKKHKLQKASPQAQLAACLSLAARAESEWYRASRAVWPTKEDFRGCMIAYSAAKEEVRQLTTFAPPSVRRPLERLLLDLEKDVEATKQVCGADEDDFLYHWILVNTRSFHWKPTGVKNGAMGAWFREQ